MLMMMLQMIDRQDIWEGLLHQQIQHLGQFYWLERKQLSHTSRPHQTTAERQEELVKQRAMK